MEKEKIHTTYPLSLDDVRHYMAQHYHEPISIDSLALLSSLSPNYFGEAFKKAYGQNATDYLTELRIGQAKKLLRETDLLLKEIALQVGYSDEFYFSRKFKKVVGISPSAYSKTNHKRISTFSVSSIGNLLALRIIPVAAPLNSKWSPYYFNYYQSNIKTHLNIFDERSEENFKRLLSAKPDIHIFQEKPCMQMVSWLESVGIQVVHIKASYWKNQLLETASALDKRKEAEYFIQTYEQRVIQAKENIQQAAGKEIFAVLRLCGEQLFLYCNKGIHEVISDLQLNIIPPQRQTCNIQISIEQLFTINPDRLLLIICPDATTRNYWLSLQYFDNWRKLKAIKKGHTYILPSNPWFEYSAISINRMLDEMQLLLTGKNPNPFPDPVHGILSNALL